MLFNLSLNINRWVFKNAADKADKLRKNHISHLWRRNPKKYRIIAFAQEVAAKKIQKHFKAYVEYKKERELIQFEQAKKRIIKNYARAVIRKYVTKYLVNKRKRKEFLDFHNRLNLQKILLIQRKFRAIQIKPIKLNIRRFKELFYYTLLGWRTRRIISYLKSLPEMREIFDFVKLRTDIIDNDHNDLFSKQILNQFSGKVKIFLDRYEDLSENAVWVKKPKEIQIQKPKVINSNKNVSSKKWSKKMSKPCNPPSNSKLQSENSSKALPTSKSILSKVEYGNKPKQNGAKEVKFEEKPRLNPNIDESKVVKNYR